MILCSINLFLFAAEEEEVKTLEIDGVIYKINPGSLNMTPADENTIVEEVEILTDVLQVEKKGTTEGDEVAKKTYDLSFNSGMIFPLDSGMKSTFFLTIVL